MSDLSKTRKNYNGVGSSNKMRNFILDENGYVRGSDAEYFHSSYAMKMQRNMAKTGGFIVDSDLQRYIIRDDSFKLVEKALKVRSSMAWAQKFKETLPKGLIVTGVTLASLYGLHEVNHLMLDGGATETLKEVISKGKDLISLNIGVGEFCGYLKDEFFKLDSYNFPGIAAAAPSVALMGGVLALGKAYGERFVRKYLGWHANGKVNYSNGWFGNSPTVELDVFKVVDSLRSVGVDMTNRDGKVISEKELIRRLEDLKYSAPVEQVKLRDLVIAFSGSGDLSVKPISEDFVQAENKRALAALRKSYNGESIYDECEKAILDNPSEAASLLAGAVCAAGREDAVESVKRNPSRILTWFVPKVAKLVKPLGLIGNERNSTIISDPNTHGKIMRFAREMGVAHGTSLYSPEWVRSDGFSYFKEGVKDKIDGAPVADANGTTSREERQYEFIKAQIEKKIVDAELGEDHELLRKISKAFSTISKDTSEFRYSYKNMSGKDIVTSTRRFGLFGDERMVGLRTVSPLSKFIIEKDDNGLLVDKAEVTKKYSDFIRTVSLASDKIQNHRIHRVDQIIGNASLNNEPVFKQKSTTLADAGRFVSDAFIKKESSLDGATSDKAESDIESAPAIKVARRHT